MNHPLATVTQIHSVANSAPELALFAAVIHKALSDAKSGDTDAQQWLGSESCTWYLSRLESDQVVAKMLQARLIEHATSEG